MDQGVSYDRVRSFYVQLTKLVFFDGVDDTFEDVLTALEAINITTEHLMYEVMQPCDMLLDRCKWLGQSMQCDKMFLVATSEEGFCCSFNYRPPLDSLEVLVVVFTCNVIIYINCIPGTLITITSTTFPLKYLIVFRELANSLEWTF